MEIKVNDYVRLKNGKIDKVFAMCGMIDNTIHLEKHKWIGQDCIVKHSKNIIDLIEEGDIIVEMKAKIPRIIRINNIEMLDRFRNGDKIYSIVTFEQFSSLEYII